MRGGSTVLTHTCNTKCCLDTHAAKQKVQNMSNVQKALYAAKHTLSLLRGANAGGHLVLDPLPTLLNPTDKQQHLTTRSQYALSHTHLG
jgi:hypothetical protein